MPNVWIRLSTAGYNFAFLEIGDAPVGQVVSHACKEFPRWGLDAGLVRIHLVAEAGDEPSEEAIGAALAKAHLAVNVTVTSGSWLVAVPTVPASGGSASPDDPVALLAAFDPPRLDARQEELLRSHQAFGKTRLDLQQGRFKASQVTRLLLSLNSVEPSTTLVENVLGSGIVLDGPLSGAVGQKTTKLHLALWMGEALCAKVGKPGAMAHEWRVSQTIHARSSAPTVARALALEDMPRKPGDDAQSLLLLPLLSLPASAARMVFALQHGATQLPAAALRCRDALAAKVALCGLAGIAAFARAGWAHGDIKPGNIMLSHGSAAGPSPCVLIDFGAAQPVGARLAECSPFGLHFPPTASLAYDLACLASTVALMQYDLPVSLGRGTGDELLAALHAMEPQQQQWQLRRALVRQGAPLAPLR